MDVQVVWLPTPLYVALIRLRLDDFTATECVAAGFGDKGNPQIHRRRYGLIYRHLIKLVNLGLLKRMKVGDPRLYPHFVKTAKFNNVAFQEAVIDLEVQEAQESSMKFDSSLLDGWKLRQDSTD